MLRTFWTRATVEEGRLVNLDDLRNELTGRLTFLLIGASGLALWLTLARKPFPLAAFLMFAILLGLGLAAQAWAETRPVLARYALVWGQTGGLLLAMGLFPAVWLPFSGLLLIFANAVLVRAGDIITAGLIAVVAAGLVIQGGRAYPLLDLVLILAVGVVVVRLVVNTLYTTLQWTQNMQQRADQLLHEVRNHRAELSRALKSSEVANSLLRRTQRELIAARRQADEARRMKEQFAANISHELRTPLNLVLGFSEVMHLSPEVYDQANWSPTLRRDIYQIYRSSRHLVDMIDDILDLSRFETAEFVLNKELTPLGPLLEDTGAIAADLFRGRNIRFETDIAPDLPALEIDRTRIRQVLLNLLNNARRFTREGLVRLAARISDKEVRISVSDTGSGIPADKLPYVFNEFFQVDLSLRRSHQGAGLGLAISKRFVQMHGGSIWVESQEGAGSTFHFTLPILSSYLPAAAAGAIEPGPEEKPAARLLVVDPDPRVMALVRRHLNQAYEIIQVPRPGQLADAVDLHHPRAVVYNVPPGEQRQPLAHPSLTMPVPVIECSLPSQAWLADHLAVVACLTKPILAENLRQTIAGLGPVSDILIVDDDRGFAQLVQRILETSGRSFNIRRAYDGEEGLLAMNIQPPDLVLLDLIMPGIDGFQVLDEMQRKPELGQVPVVLLTATSFAEDALSRGDNPVTVCRPGGLRPAEVLACMQAVIEVLEPHYDEKSIPDGRQVGRMHIPDSPNGA